MAVIREKLESQSPPIRHTESADTNELIHVIIEIALDRVALTKSRRIGAGATYRRARLTKEETKSRLNEREGKLAELKKAVEKIAPGTHVKEIRSGNSVAALLTPSQIQQLDSLPYVRRIRENISHRF